MMQPAEDTAEGTPPIAPHPAVPHHVFRRALAKVDQSVIVWILVIVMFPLSRMFSTNFPSWALFNSTIVLGLFLAIVAWGQGLVVLTGGIDLSVAAVVTVSAFFTGYLATQGMPTAFAIICGILIASIVGLVNGLIVAKFKFPAFIVTLATAAIASSLLLGFSKGAPGQSSPPELANLFKTSSDILGVPVTLILLVLVFLLGFWVQSRTPFGRRIYAIGNSAQASRMAGIKIDRHLVFVYWLATISYAVAGVLLLGYSSGSNLNIGAPWLLPSIAAVVVGGASIAGGSGTYVGTVGAALLITILSTDITAAGLSQGVQQILYGAIIVAALVLIKFGGVKRS